MELHNNLKSFHLLLFFSYLLLPTNLAQPKVSPTPSPVSSPSPGPSPTRGGEYVDDEIETEILSISLPPSSSESPSTSPPADAPSDSDGSIEIFEFDLELDLSPAPSPSSESDSESESDASPQLKKICDSTDYPSLCRSTVAPFLDDGETDVQSVLDISIQAGAQFSKYAQATAQKLAGNPGNPPQHASVLNDCTDSFENAAENYGKAGDALSEQDKGTVNSMLSAVITYVSDCQVKISKESQLYGITDKLINTTSNCLAISSLMN